MPYGPSIKHSPTVTVVSVSNSEDTPHTFKVTTHAFTLKANEAEVIRIAWVENEADDDATGQFMVLSSGETYWEDHLRLGSNEAKWTSNSTTQLTIYMHAPDAASSVDVAIIEWQ